MMRIDQFISQSAQISRRDVKKAMKEKRVLVNGAVCKDPSTRITPSDIVMLDSEVVPWPCEQYIMLNKPAGYCCSHHDDGYPSALRLLPAFAQKLHFAGRLDADTTGLVLLSSDGQWCHRVTSPKQRCEKRKLKYYRVTLSHELSPDDLRALEDGILLRGEKSPTLPATIQPLSSTQQCHSVQYNIAITEGRYHQVKRMFAATGNQVQSLHRYQIADIRLDDALAEGNFRTLTTDEINQF